MKILLQLFYIISACLFISACNSPDNEQNNDRSEKMVMHNSHNDGQHKDNHGGHHSRTLSKDDFSIQLGIFQTGLASEMRAWIKNKEQSVNPQDVILKVWLQRLGSDKELIHFYPESDYLRGNTMIVEPHSFKVVVEAKYQSKQYLWAYDSFEGRTTIPADLAKSFNIQSSVAGPATIYETINVYGQIVANPENVRNISARFDGVILNVTASIGSFVKKGKSLATIESNESLNTYSIKAPISGILTQRYANSGEQTNGRLLFTIVDISKVWANLNIFPNEREAIKLGNEVDINTTIDNKHFTGKITNINILRENNQAIIARAPLNNPDNKLLPGTYVSAQITIDKHHIPVAVKRSALQQIDDSSIVFIQVDDQYEARTLKLGRADKEWVEVLNGITAGTRYVSLNSYIVKADIEKAGAGHNH